MGTFRRGLGKENPRRVIGENMAKKKKSASVASRTSKKRAQQSSAAARGERSSAPTGSAKFAGAALTSNLRAAVIPAQCPTHVYDGTVLLQDEERESFLKTTAGTYLMLLDDDCSGTFSQERVAAAYDAFSQNPGRNQRLTCNGFLHEDGTSWVLHVVG
jgi:hypothetical protein